MQSEIKSLVARFKKGDDRGLARLITFVENNHSDLLEIMSALPGKKNKSQIIGITGPPGAGKSTLADRLITEYRQLNKTVGVLAIDPSSPFSGGAVLGDRIRMQNHAADSSVFIRSLGSRGAHGGLSSATRGIVHLMEAFGFDVILVETVGVGQTELDIMSVANTTVVVLVPESGDTIQTMKAGLMEIADIFVVNKADREGADRIASELATLSETYSKATTIPVIKTALLVNHGITAVVEAIQKHSEQISNNKKSLQREMIWQECLDIVVSEIKRKLIEKKSSQNKINALRKEVLAGKLNTYQAAKELLHHLKF